MCGVGGLWRGAASRRSGARTSERELRGEQRGGRGVMKFICEGTQVGLSEATESG